MRPKSSTAPRKRPQQERSQVTVQAILTAAAHILTEEGYDNFTTNKVAERAGVSIGSLYQYFPNKESLVFALADHHANEMVELAQHYLTEVEDCSLMEVLQRIIKAAVAAHALNPKLHRVLHEQVPHSEVIQQLDKAKTDNLLRAFLSKRRDQLQPKNLDLTVFLVERTIRSLIYGAMTDQPELLSTGELEQEMVKMLSAYLLAAGELEYGAMKRR